MRMWTPLSEPLAGRRGVRTRLEAAGAPVSYAEVLRLWRHDAGFRSFFTALLAAAPYTAFRWETPPLSTHTVTRPFEFVVLDSPGLAGRPDPAPFAQHFGGAAAPAGVVTFANLGRDAVLVVPTPAGAHSAYGHLAAFVREAPEGQRQALWQAVGEAAEDRLSAAPVWISTAGAGVSWLHVRLDDRPKYYGYSPYRTAG